MSATPIWHPIVGDGYYPINDDELEAELAGAEIIEENAMFKSFTLIVGYRNKAFSADGHTAQPFLCIKNHMPGAAHLFTTKD